MFPILLQVRVDGGIPWFMYNHIFVQRTIPLYYMYDTRIYSIGGLLYFINENSKQIFDDFEESQTILVKVIAV